MCPFQIIYPIGCHLHICEFQIVPMLPVLLYDMEISNSPDQFTCRRPGWPYEDTVIGFPVYGAVQVNEGVPYIIFCKDHTKSQMRKEVSNWYRKLRNQCATIKPNLCCSMFMSHIIPA
jgi:hypothetical protein